MAASVHVGDVGTRFVVTIKENGTAIDVSSATAAGSKLIRFYKPDGVVLVVTASFLTDGTDGKLKYDAVVGDLSKPGEWSIQAFISITGWSGHTEVKSFNVRPVLGQ